MCHPFAQPNSENKFFELDHQISSRCHIRRFLTVITNFLGALSQKKKMTFREITNQDSKIFFKCMMMGQLNKKRKENEKRDSRVKTQKRQSRAKMRRF